MRQHWVRFAAVGLVTGLLLGGCGGDDADEGSSADRTGQAGAAAGKTATGAVPTVKPANPAEAHLAVAVADTKTSAPIDLLYDLPAKPEVGQSFTLELTVKPRVAGDALDVEIGDSPGIDVDGERQTRFIDVVAAEPYKFAVQARGATEGLFYVTVSAKLSNQVQTQGRAWSVPVVIGNPPAAEKTAPPIDASGQPVQSLPAQEG